MDSSHLYPATGLRAPWSIVMLSPGQPAGLDRERACQLLEELQRRQRSDRRYQQLVEQLRAILDGLKGG